MYQTLISQNKDPALMKVKVSDRQALKKTKNHILLKCWLVMSALRSLATTLTCSLHSTHTTLSSVQVSFSPFLSIHCFLYSKYSPLSC